MPAVIVDRQGASGRMVAAIHFEEGLVGVWEEWSPSISRRCWRAPARRRTGVMSTERSMSVGVREGFDLEDELAALDPAERDAAAAFSPPIRRAPARRWRS